MTGERNWLHFEVAEREYALPLDAITEVTAARRPHLVPLVPLSVGGVLNVRGEPLPVVDGGVLMGGRTLSEARHALVLGEDSARVGVLVEAVSRIDRGLEDAGPDETQAPPADSPGFVRWVRHEGKTIGLVDEDALLVSATERLVMPFGGSDGLSRVGQTGEEEQCRNEF